MTEPRVDIPGSERTLPEGITHLGDVDPGERGEVTVVLRRRPGATAHTAGRLTREQLLAEMGADPADIDRVRAFAAAHGLEVVSADPASRSVILAGPLGSLSDAFGTSLARYQGAHGEFRGRTGPISVPAGIGDAVDAVLGLDDRPQLHAHFRVATAAVPADRRTHRTASLSYTAPELARVYDFPTGVDGSGETIAILEFGGGYRPADLAQYFTALGVRQPSVESVSVDGAANTPGQPADLEVVLDIEVAGAVAPGARLAVYFAPNSDRGFADCLAAAVHDAVRKPSVVSISWGGPESTWSAQGLRVLDALMQDAATLGVTVLVASGDDGSNDRVGDGLAHCDFPASSPWALACGGTRLVAANGVVSSETVWHETNGAGGGGISDVFALPDYQRSAGVPVSANPGGRVGRGVPDVAGDADPQTGYTVHYGGSDTVIGGTSAVAPLWAGLVALCNQALGRPVGHLHPALYSQVVAGGGFRDITSGNNGAYSAAAGWDACTGLGVPVGSRLLAALRAASGAGSVG